jgi:hypothetical protein
MNMPGFSADAALPRRFSGYGAARVGGVPAGVVVPMQIMIEPLPPPPPILPDPLLPPNPLPPDWPMWPPYSPTGPDLPPAPPRLPPDIIIDVLEATGEVLVAVGIGLIVGGVTGKVIEKLTTPPDPTPLTVTPGCATIGSKAPKRIQESWWGCERSMVKTIASANAECASRPNQCSPVTCPNGRPCTAEAVITSGPVQTPGIFSCETYFWYTCECGC